MSYLLASLYKFYVNYLDTHFQSWLENFFRNKKCSEKEELWRFQMLRASS